MSIKIIRNRDVFTSLLKYDSSVGPIGEISASDVVEVDIYKMANYIKLHGKYFGIYASPNGPYFFYQDKEFNLNNKCIFQHLKGEYKHKFKFIYDKNLVIDIEYNKWEDIDIDPWSEEDFIDFFIWITNSFNFNRQEFVNMWTIK